MDDDRQLLRQFVEHNSQEAFASLTKRYLSLVYSVCRRELDNAETAEDVTQAVFLILARKAPTFRRGVVLSGWLFQTARFAAKNARIQETRRMAYEQKAMEEMEQQSESEDAAWAEIEPLLNPALASLREADRQCVLLRFFQGLSFAEMGETLGLSEEAARKRLTRSLEKMRRFFGKEGVIVPGVALATLLSAHAAKAVPATCQANLGVITNSVLTGHLSASLAGSHAYQLSEGVLKAMKILQIKVAVGLTAAAVVGLTTYSVAKRIVLPIMAAHQVSPLIAAPKPGHILSPVPGKTLTAVQIAARSRDAYAALTSYQGTTTVFTRGTSTQFPTVREYHSSANIQFVRPGKIHVEGKDSSGYALAYISDGNETKATFLGLNNWKKQRNPEMAVAGMTGIAFSAATTIPAVLLRIKWGIPLALGNSPDAEIREDTVEGKLYYVLTTHLTTPKLTETEYLWIDEKTFLLHRSVIDRNNPAQTMEVSGRPYSLSASQTQIDQRFTDERLNEAIPDSTFTLPSSQ